MTGLALFFLVFVFGVLFAGLAFCLYVNAKYGQSEAESESDVD